MRTQEIKERSPCTQSELVCGSFLADEHATWIKDQIHEADVIVANNLVFDPITNNMLEELFFADCKVGCIIISSKSWGGRSGRSSANRRSERGKLNPTYNNGIITVTGLASRLTVAKVTYEQSDGVSWAPGPFSYYIQTITRRCVVNAWRLFYML